MSKAKEKVSDEELKKWVVLYPNFINLKKKTSEGRRIPLSLSVENPTCNDIAEACASLKLPHVIQSDKGYPRDPFTKGRVKVKLFLDENATPVNPAIDKRMTLFKEVAKAISLKPRASSSQASSSKTKKKKK
eukprot:GCRY01002009.1.p1 GENE.GCRY01002009.1~~GCRY01002009.1.p1  ORF type:complete len:132 (+),score=10.39 GCRY01002009.1:248-643(+)